MSRFEGCAPFLTHPTHRPGRGARMTWNEDIDEVSPPVDTFDYDLADFDRRDEIDAQVDQDLSELLTGRPARPGTVRG